MELPQSLLVLPSLPPKLAAPFIDLQIKMNGMLGASVSEGVKVELLVNVLEASNNPWAQNLEHTSTVPANLDLYSPETGLARRGAVTKGTPRSGGAVRSPRSSRLFDDPGSSSSTPRMDIYQKSTPMTAPTPPFSPGMESFNRSLQKVPNTLPSKALPTPPLRSYEDERNPDLTMLSGSAKRPISQNFTPASIGTIDSTMKTPRLSGPDAFAQAAIDRHRHFIEKEMAARTDQDRLELFAEFIVTESRFRRDRYSGAFDAMAGDIVDLTRDLWRSYGTTGRRSATPSKQRATVGESSRSQTSVTAGSPDTRFSNSNADNSSKSSIINWELYAQHCARVSIQCIKPKGSRCVLEQQLLTLALPYSQHGNEHCAR